MKRGTANKEPTDKYMRMHTGHVCAKKGENITFSKSSGVILNCNTPRNGFCVAEYKVGCIQIC